MKIYFAGSIRGGRKDAETYQELIEFINTLGDVLTEHIGAAKLSEMGENNLSDEQIYSRDMEWLSASDAIIAEVTTPSLGVGYEIGSAEAMGKPILCLYNSQGDFQISCMLSGNSRLTVKFYQNLDEAKMEIRNFILALEPNI